MRHASIDVKSGTTHQLPQDIAEKFKRISDAFELIYTHDGVDAEVRRRSTGKIIKSPNSATQAIRVDRRYVESFYRIKLALHIGRMPVPQVDHENLIRHDNRLVNLREADARQNSRNKGPAKRADAALPRTVYQLKDGRYLVKPRDENGRRKQYGPYRSLTEATRVAREYRAKRDGKFHRATPPGFRSRNGMNSTR